ncbi:MAG: apolipoprotein N-acyltransferase, partial [Polyangiaceae bacterium]
MVVGATRDNSLLRAAAGGLLFGLATPPTDVLLGVPLGLLLLARALRSAKSVRRGALLGIVWATTAGLIGMRFIPSVITLFTDLGQVAAIAAHLLLSAAQSLWWGLGMGL